MNKKQTTEKLIGEVFITLLIFITIGVMVNRLSRWDAEQKDESTIEDLHQQQEIIGVASFTRTKIKD